MIKVKTLTGKEIEIDIELTDTVDRIKERVEEKEGIPPVQQRLIFAGKQMNDEKTAKEYNIEGGSVLHLVRNANWPTKGVSPPLSPTPSSPSFTNSHLPPSTPLSLSRSVSRSSPSAVAADSFSSSREGGGTGR